MTDHAMLLWTRIAAISTGVLAVATFWLGYVAYLQFKDSHLGVVTTQRAFFYFTPASDSFVKDKSGNKYIRQIVNLINSGNRQTKDLKFFIRCADSTTELPEPFVLLFKGEIAASPSLLGPKASFP